jgi:hypothetical protein
VFLSQSVANLKRRLVLTLSLVAGIACATFASAADKIIVSGASGQLGSLVVEE